jgi:hypothetical protein
MGETCVGGLGILISHVSRWEEAQSSLKGSCGISVDRWMNYDSIEQPCKTILYEFENI